MIVRREEKRREEKEISRKTLEAGLFRKLHPP